MNTLPDPSDALTVPADLNAIPWADTNGRCEFSRQLSLALEGNDMLFQDTVPIGELTNSGMGFTAV
jgi:hypothetical protein